MNHSTPLGIRAKIEKEKSIELKRNIIFGHLNHELVQAFENFQETQKKPGEEMVVVSLKINE